MKRPADGGAETVGVPDSGITEFQPSLSPDGTKVCFTLSNGGFNATASILVADTANPASQIVISSSGFGDYNCTFSPDGTKIAYVTGTFTSGALVMENSDNSGGFVVLEDDAANFDGNPDWAPDGRPRCEDLEVAATVNTPVSIPLPCDDTGPAYERTEVRAFVPAEGEPANGTVTEDVVTIPGSVDYTSNPGFVGTDTFKVRSFDGIAFGDRDGTVNVRIDPPGEGPPDGVVNDFTLGKVKKNKKKGTAKVTVEVPNPGDLVLAKSKKVRPDDDRADAGGAEKLQVKAKGKAKKRLAEKGKTKVNVQVTYTPDGGDANTKSRQVKLVLK
jgi:hypothetical protein